MSHRLIIYAESCGGDVIFCESVILLINDYCELLATVPRACGFVKTIVPPSLTCGRGSCIYEYIGNLLEFGRVVIQNNER